MDNKNLEKSILSTICYFDIFDYPLTLMEIWQWLFDGSLIKQPVDLLTVKKTLEDSLYLNNRLSFKAGFYFLKNRDDIISVRAERYKIAQPKFKKILAVSKILSYFPFIKMIAISNTLAGSNSRLEGDLDLFIITSAGKVWPARFWVLLFLTIFNLRPTTVKSQDKICTAFFIDESAYNLKDLALDKQDPHFVFWLRQIFPIYGLDVYKSFFDANYWIKEFLPQAGYIESFQRQIAKNKLPIKFFAEAVSNLLPIHFYKVVQYWLMPAVLKEMSNQDTRVVINERILKFHKNDRRELYKNIFQDNLAKNL